MHIIWWSSHHDCQWSQDSWHYWFLQMLLYWLSRNFHYLVCISKWEGHLWKSLQIAAWFLETDEEATKIMKEIISPRILPINFTAGKDVPSYEFYNPSVAAKRLGFGQVPPSPFFVGKVQFRGVLNGSLSYNWLKDLKPDVDMALLADWQITPFVTTLFTQWWSEWQEHIFCKAANLYCIALNENYQAAENEVRNQTHLFCCIIMFFIYL